MKDAETGEIYIFGPGIPDACWVVLASENSVCVSWDPEDPSTPTYVTPAV